MNNYICNPFSGSFSFYYSLAGTTLVSRWRIPPHRRVALVLHYPQCPFLSESKCDLWQIERSFQYMISENKFEIQSAFKSILHFSQCFPLNFNIFIALSKRIYQGLWTNLVHKIGKGRETKHLAVLFWHPKTEKNAFRRPWPMRFAGLRASSVSTTCGGGLKHITYCTPAPSNSHQRDYCIFCRESLFAFICHCYILLLGGG